ncbi:DUF3151 domain-containing protein [Corynebacterium ciconiae]|uniref:DUF3151 domain-containing protein n=1 Tax=Corynebacterium ciconiae TaxID=227319 RepID=UPI00035D8EB6|nr:DUF3151 domain-containing protein [Corynebacterium ciconiae]
MAINNLMAPQPVHLPADPAAERFGAQPQVSSAGLSVDSAAVEAAHEAVREYPSSSLAWSILAIDALDRGADVAAYAYARTGYHRGLDALRGSGWKGFGPVPHSHEPNRGVLYAIAALALAAQRIGETDEYERCAALLEDCDHEAAASLIV